MRRFYLSTISKQSNYIEVAEAAQQLAWITEAGGYCTYLSTRWYQFTGQEPGQGEGFGWLWAVHPDDRARASQAFFSADREQVAYGVHYRIVSKDGRYWSAWAHGTPFFNDAGRFDGFLGVTNPFPELSTGSTIPLPRTAKPPTFAGKARLLTERERQVLTLIAQGHTTYEVAESLKVGVRTIEHHISMAALRLNATNRTHACVTALRLNEIAFPGEIG